MKQKLYFLPIFITVLFFLTSCDNSIKNLNNRGSSEDESYQSDESELVDNDIIEKPIEEKDEVIAGDLDTPLLENDVPIIDAQDDSDMDEELNDGDEEVSDPCENVRCGEFSYCVSENGTAVCECIEGYHKNADKCVPDNEIVKTGSFSMEFKGPVNQGGENQQLEGGEGDTEFSHFENDYTFTVVPVNLGYTNFNYPLASLTDAQSESPRNFILWIDVLNFSGKTKFFAFSYPNSYKFPGKFDMKDSEAVALYGDLSLTMEGIKIECIRSLGGAGTYNILPTDSMDFGSISVTAEGQLFDPAIASDNLEYPICETN